MHRYDSVVRANEKVVRIGCSGGRKVYSAHWLGMIGKAHQNNTFCNVYDIDVAFVCPDCQQRVVCVLWFSAACVRTKARERTNVSAGAPSAIENSPMPKSPHLAEKKLNTAPSPLAAKKSPDALKAVAHASMPNSRPSNNIFRRDACDSTKRSVSPSHCHRPTAPSTLLVR